MQPQRKSSAQTAAAAAPRALAAAVPVFTPATHSQVAHWHALIERSFGAKIERPVHWSEVLVGSLSRSAGPVSFLLTLGALIWWALPA